MPAKRKTTKSKPSAAEIEIEQRRKEILHKQKLLEEQLVRLPAEMAAERARQERARRERAVTSGPSVSRIGIVRPGSRSSGVICSRHQAKREKLKFVGMIVVIFLLAFVAWHFFAGR